MAIKKIRTNDDPVLKRKAKKVTNIDDRLERLLTNMLDTMYEAEGIGLAAPQIGISKRVIVVDIGEDEIYQLINPEIVDTSDEQEKALEGCLSYPGLQGRVTRPVKVTVKALNPQEEEMIIEAEGLLARALQHEIDHLDGITFIDRAEEVFREEESH
ncbi:peptide deformylase [Natranaerobius thermophilus]|uniref:Peptide deformylase n=1 Tax=Natranaerobius thermophilus (strain ATCC BAA-1301 / DSM 18059 / JW/NM-WN-LF) TaxID=457570 RepID=DEF_NATTJ|nr:peptide deformylase [Natranaerobius thermophilus]B2A2K1.1 RecName: Full=Peptide deformylase; Short=PDF; AltName: Full=Polypeptide deformylase [Natranaerobius thermophilus JW/NM-WN-LF]ACB84916.1 peptide deformylase [Natranaerobius thermophilus JW/NM-WN-LF]